MKTKAHCVRLTELDLRLIADIRDATGVKGMTEVIRIALRGHASALRVQKPSRSALQRRGPRFVVLCSGRGELP